LRTRPLLDRSRAFSEWRVYPANRDARVRITEIQSMHYRRVHRLDRIIANIPAKLLDSKSLTLGFSRKQIWPVYLCDPVRAVPAGSTCMTLTATEFLLTQLPSCKWPRAKARRTV